MNSTSVRLEKVDLSEIWKNEAGDFKPWLGTDANIRILSDAFGIDLDVHAKEKQVCLIQ